MGATHQNGPITGTRQGSLPVFHSFPLALTDTVAKKLVTVEASPTKPVRVRVGFITDTAFNGTTPTVSIGSTTTANEFLSAITPAAAVTDFGTPVTKLLKARTDIYAKYAGGGSNTLGSGYVTLTLEELNISAQAN